MPKLNPPTEETAVKDDQLTAEIEVSDQPIA